MRAFQRWHRALVYLFVALSLGDTRAAVEIDPGFSSAIGANDAVVTAIALPDDTLVLGGLFTTYQGSGAVGLVKLAGNGQRLSTFNAQLEVPEGGGVFATALQGGRVIAGGAFTKVRGTTRAGLVRLLDDGRPDPQFVPPFAAPTVVTALALASDGKIYVAGALVLASAPSQPRWLVRLNENGTLDPTFQSSPELFEYDAYNVPLILALAVDQRGRLLFGGDFQLRGPVNTTPAASRVLLRLLPNGDVDSGFRPSSAAGGMPTRVMILPDDRLLVANVSATAAGGGTGITRLHPDGSLDRDFHPKLEGPYVTDFDVNRVLVHPTGHIIVGGDFTGVAGTPVAAFAVLRADGSPDPRYVLPGNPNGAVVDLVATSDGGVLVVGDFTEIGGQGRGRVAKLRFTAEPAQIAELTATNTALKAGENVVLRAAAHGAPPLTFTWQRNGQTVQAGSDASLAIAGVQPDDAGTYEVKVTAADQTSATATIALTVEPRLGGGHFDDAFAPAFEDDNASSAIMDDGTVVLGNAVGSGRWPMNFARGPLHLTSTGEVDAAFLLRNASVSDLSLRPDGRLWIASNSGHLNISTSIGLARVNRDFSLDPSFAPQLPAGIWYFSAIAATPSGGVAFLGSTAGLPASIGVLRADGSLDPAFNGGALLPVGDLLGSSSFKRMLVVSAEGWIYCAQVGMNGFLRFRPDGSQDTSISSDYALIPSLDGKIYLLGPGGYWNRVHRVAPDGSFDPTYKAPTEKDWYGGAVDAKGRLYGIYNQQLVRLHPDGTLDPSYLHPGPFAQSRVKAAVSPSGDFFLIQKGFAPDLGSGLLRFSDEPTGPARLINLSARGVAGTGNETLIAGFSIRGSGAMPLLLRGIGPALGPHGVGRALTAARLQLYRGSIGGEFNEGWSSVPGLTELGNRVGAFPLPDGSKDAALSPSLAPGLYTSMVTPAGDAAAGIALAEIYDAHTAAEPDTRLVNISARGLVGNGEDVLIAGFVLSGTGARQLLIRAVGPTLVDLGVQNVQEAPVVRLMQEGRELSLNAGWNEVAFPEVVAAAARKVGAFAVAPSRGDAAILVRLPPGLYTAIVSGATNEPGIGLVEVYEVPE